MVFTNSASSISQKTINRTIVKLQLEQVPAARVFGYANIEVDKPNATSIEVEGAVVRRVFDLRDGPGDSAIAKQLNAEGGVLSASTGGPPARWSPSTVPDVLRWELYRGMLLWNRTKKQRMAGAPVGAPATDDGSRRSLVRRVGGQDQVADGLLTGGISNGPEERKAASLAVHRVLPGGERDVATGASAALPDREANELEAGEDTVDELDLSVSELSRRVSLVVRNDLHDGVLRGDDGCVRVHDVLLGTACLWVPSRLEELQRAVKENGASGRDDKRGHSGAGVTAAFCWHSRVRGAGARALVSALAVETGADATPHECYRRLCRNLR
jgi:hypothetical protein